MANGDEAGDGVGHAGIMHQACCTAQDGPARLARSNAPDDGLAACLRLLDQANKGGGALAQADGFVLETDGGLVFAMPGLIPRLNVIAIERHLFR